MEDPGDHKGRDRLIRALGITETRWMKSAGSPAPDELVIMDRAGRLQLPPSHVRALGLADGGRAQLEADYIRILPHESDEIGSSGQDGDRSRG